MSGSEHPGKAAGTSVSRATVRRSHPLRVAIFEPYVLGTKLYGNARYIACIFKYLSPDKFKPILYAPIEGDLVEMIDREFSGSTVVPAPRLLQAYDGSILSHGPLSKALVFASMLFYAIR